MDAKDLLTIGEVARRSGFPQSALRYYEREGLVRTDPDLGWAAPLRAVGAAPAGLHPGRPHGRRRAGRGARRARPAARRPDARTGRTGPGCRRSWRGRLDEQIDALVALRDGLDSCIGCGCLSLQRCQLSNPGDRMAAAGPGARLLPPMLRRAPAEGV